MLWVGVGFRHSSCFGSLSLTRGRFLLFGTMANGVCWRTRSLTPLCLRGCHDCIVYCVRALCAVDGLLVCDVDDVSGMPFARLGARGLSVGGRIPLHPVVVADLSSLFRRAGGIASLRFPSFW